MKNPLSGQTAANAIHQYRYDRDQREPIFLFTKRSLVHFAVDTDEAHMTTRLAGTSTHFLPFNQGWDGGAGNPRSGNGGGGNRGGSNASGQRSGSRGNGSNSSNNADQGNGARQAAPRQGGRQGAGDGAAAGMARRRRSA